MLRWPRWLGLRPMGKGLTLLKRRWMLTRLISLSAVLGFAQPAWSGAFSSGSGAWSLAFGRGGVEMDPVEFHDFVIVPALDQVRLNQPGASLLLLGTALVESDLNHLRQQSDGPALGVFQMEPATHDDLWLWLTEYARDKELGRAITRLTAAWPPGATQMVGNLTYATVMARCQYRRRPEPLPFPHHDLPALALYWKKHYNTFQPEQTQAYVEGQITRFIDLFPKELLTRSEDG